MGAWRSKLQAPGPFHPVGGVDRPAVGVAHPPAFVQPTLTAPGPWGRGDPPDAGLPPVPAALLPLSRLRPRSRLLQPAVSPRGPRPESPRGRPAAPAEPGRPARSPRSPAGLPRPVPRARDASDFPGSGLLWHSPSLPAPDTHGGCRLQRAWRDRCANHSRSLPRSCPPLRLLWPPGPLPALGGSPRPRGTPAGRSGALSRVIGAAHDPRRAGRRDPPALLR